MHVSEFPLFKYRQVGIYRCWHIGVFQVSLSNRLRCSGRACCRVYIVIVVAADASWCAIVSCPLLVERSMVPRQTMPVPHSPGTLGLSKEQIDNKLFSSFKLVCCTNKNISKSPIRSEACLLRKFSFN